MVYGSVNASTHTQSPEKPATVYSVIESFDPLIDRLEMLAKLAMSCGDKIVGVRPGGGEEAKDVPLTTGLIAAAQFRHDLLAHVVSRLEDEMACIERGLS